jgi:hypothetical protein
MYAFDIASDAPKSELYANLLSAADALTGGESDGIANMANISALLWQFLPDLNWAGFYRMVDDELVLGRSIKACAARPRAKRKRSGSTTSMPFRGTSPVMRTADPNWSYPCCGAAPLSLSLTSTVRVPCVSTKRMRKALRRWHGFSLIGFNSHSLRRCRQGRAPRWEVVRCPSKVRQHEP